MKDILTETCKNCGSNKFKIWGDLNEDEKFLIERLPKSAEYSNEQRKKQHFCKRCFYVVNQNNSYKT